MKVGGGLGAWAAGLLMGAACGGTVAPSGTSDAGAPETGAASTVGTIACGASTCSAASELCCNDYSGSGARCVKSCNVGDWFSCDGPEDCSSGMRCCAVIRALGTQASCKATCTWGRDLQLCHTDAECEGAPGGSTRCCPINESLYPGIGSCEAECR